MRLLADLPAKEAKLTAIHSLIGPDNLRLIRPGNSQLVINKIKYFIIRRRIKLMISYHVIHGASTEIFHDSFQTCCYLESSIAVFSYRGNI
jgi:hypothetical protein